MGREIKELLALISPLPAMQAATLATTATLIAENKLAKQLSKL